MSDMLKDLFGVEMPSPDVDALTFNQKLREAGEKLMRDQAEHVARLYGYRPEDEGKAIANRPLSPEQIARARQQIADMNGQIASMIARYLRPEPIIISADQIADEARRTWP